MESWNRVGKEAGPYEEVTCRCTELLGGRESDDESTVEESSGGVLGIKFKVGVKIG